MVATPWVLWATLATMVGVFVSHLLSVRRPPVLMLPTTRFLPERTVRAVSMSARPTDVPLLLLRMLAVLCAGLAFAGVQWSGTRDVVANLVVIDAAAAGDDSLAWRAAVDQAMQSAPIAAVVLANGRVISGDTLARRADSLDVTPSRDGTIASALLAARRSAVSIASYADSVALVLVSPLRADASTEVLDTVRAMWPGRITVIPVLLATTADSLADAPRMDAIVNDERAEPSVTVRSPNSVAVRSPTSVTVRSPNTDDVISAAFTRWRTLVTANTRVVRDGVTSDDSSFAKLGGVLVLWPDASGATDSSHPPAVVANGRALIARGLTATSPQADSVTTPASHTIVWWPDGSAAATEHVLGNGCVREVLFTAPTNDALLQPSARGVLSALSAPCGVAGSMGRRPALTEGQLAILRGDGPLATADALDVPGAENEWARWLALGAIACLLAELLLRRGSKVLLA